MDYPDSDAYNQMFENADRHFVDSAFLNGGKPKRRKNGRGFVAWQGGLARVYAFVDKDGRQFVVRCWLTDPGNLSEDYFSAVSGYLRDQNLFVTTVQLANNQYPPNAYFANFEFRKQGVELNTVKYPIMRMDWVEGERLNQFIDNNYSDSVTIALLADRFVEMAKYLHKKQVSHGDLQTGNLIVLKTDDGPRIILIDYDSLYVPTLPPNFSSAVIGLPGFQHPLRMKGGVKIAPLKIDYFSELIIALSLYAIADNPKLWIEGTDQKLLFDNQDLVSPQNSKIFRELQASRNPTVRELTEALVDFCRKRNLNDLRPLEEITTTEIWAAFKGQLGLGAAKEAAPEKISARQDSKDIGPPTAKKRKSKTGSGAVFGEYFGSGTSPTKETHCPKCHKEFDKVGFYFICPHCEAAVYGLVVCPLCKDERKIPKKVRYCPYCRGKPQWN